MMRRLAQSTVFLKTLLATFVFYALLPLLSAYELSCHNSSQQIPAEHYSMGSGDGVPFGYECSLCYLAAWENSSVFASKKSTPITDTLWSAYAVSASHAHWGLACFTQSIRAPPALSIL